MTARSAAESELLYVAFGKPDLQCSLCVGAVSLQPSCVGEPNQHDPLLKVVVW